MSNEIHIIIAIGILILTLGLIAYLIRKKAEDKKNINYKAIFILGIVFLPMGLTLDNPAFTALGITYTIVGIANKGQWDKK